LEDAGDQKYGGPKEFINQWKRIYMKETEMFSSYGIQEWESMKIENSKDFFHIFYMVFLHLQKQLWRNRELFITG
jgi:hypothetical protein